MDDFDVEYVSMGARENCKYPNRHNVTPLGCQETVL